jgi:hypothetical protein
LLLFDDKLSVAADGSQIDEVLNAQGEHQECGEQQQQAHAEAV